MREKLKINNNHKNPKTRNLNSIETIYWDVFDIKGLKIRMQENFKNDIRMSCIIRLELNPRRINGDNTYIGVTDQANGSRFIEKVDFVFDHLTSYLPSIDYFSVYRLDYCHNNKFSSIEELQCYVEILRRGTCPKRFKRKMLDDPIGHRMIPSRHELAIQNKSVSIVFYDKLSQMLDPNNRASYKPSDQDFKDAEGLLWMEISCGYQKLYKRKKLGN